MIGRSLIESTIHHLVGQKRNSKMSDRDRETLEQIKKILGMIEEAEEVEKETKELEEQAESINILRDALEKQVSMKFTIKDMRFAPLMEMIYDPVDASGNMPDPSHRVDHSEYGEGSDYEELDREDKYDCELEDCLRIFLDRNAIYKDTFVHLGLMGTITTLIGDCFRLRNMILHEADHGRSHYSEIEDKLRDVVNQAVISLMMLHEDNFEGK
jgi:hypothetical protein